MKKFTYLGVALLASVLALAGCSNQGGSTAPTSAPTSAPVTPSVISLELSPKSSTIGIDEEVTLNANFIVSGEVDRSVTWVSSDPSVATVVNGKVTGLKEGQVTITGTSVFDPSKSDTATVKVVDKGFLPELYAAGYTYYKTWPEAEIKNWIGTGTYDVSAPSDVSKGAYLKAFAASTDSVAYLDVVVDGDQAASYFAKMGTEGYHTWTELYFGIFEVNCAIDPTKTFEVDPSEYYDESYTEVIATELYFYHASELFEDDTLTENTAWSADELAEFAKVADVEAIPFVKLGASYEVAAYEGDEEGVYEGVSIADYSLAWDALDSYGQTLLDAGYVYNEDYEAYTKEVASKTYLEQYVMFSWGSSGNTIDVGVTTKVLDAWPSVYLDAFTSSVLQSKLVVPCPAGTADQFTFDVAISEEVGKYAQVSGYSYSYNEFKAYAAALETAGYEVELSEQSEEDYGSFSAAKGKIEMVGVYYNDYDYDAEAYSDEAGQIALFIYQGSGYEDPGLYFSESFAKVSIGGTYQIDATLFEIEGTVSYVSNHPEIATVSEAGLVSGVAEGTATITGSVTYNEVTYTANIEISVVNEVTDVITLASTGVTAGTTYQDFTITTSDSGAKYAGQCAAGGSYNCIQIRSNKSNSGLVVTEAPVGMVCTSIKVTFNENNTSTKNLNFYSSDTAYSTPADLFSSTPVGSKAGVAGESVTYEYETAKSFVGIASASGAFYIDSIEVTWAPAA